MLLQKNCNLIEIIPLFFQKEKLYMLINMLNYLRKSSIEITVKECDANEVQ